MIDTNPDSNYDSGEPIRDPATYVTFCGSSDDRLHLEGHYRAEVTHWRPDGRFEFENGLVVEVSSTTAEGMVPTSVPDDCTVNVEGFYDPHEQTRTAVESESHIGDWEYIPADEEVSD